LASGHSGGLTSSEKRGRKALTGLQITEAVRPRVACTLRAIQKAFSAGTKNRCPHGWAPPQIPTASLSEGFAYVDACGYGIEVNADPADFAVGG